MANYNITTSKPKIVIHCEGKAMTDNLVITNEIYMGEYEEIEEISSVVEITFTIDGTSYTAEEGMTWETYKGSEYDVLGLYDYIGYVASSVLSNNLVCIIPSVKWTDIIQNGGTYTTRNVSGGGAE